MMFLLVVLILILKQIFTLVFKEKLYKLYILGIYYRNFLFRNFVKFQCKIVDYKIRIFYGRGLLSY